jgi:hypothetical protein
LTTGYLQALLKKIKERLPRCPNISFVDDIGLLARGNSVEEIARQLEEAGVLLVQLGMEYKVGFDEEKIEAVLFTRGRKHTIAMKKARIKLPNFTCSFRKEVTRWLGF